MSTYNLGRILPVFKGNWESSNNYFPLDVVLYSGSSYVAKSNISARGNNPANNNNWQMIAAAGEISGTLTPAQEQAIINAVIQQGGFVSDANYTHTDNNFTDSYKNAIDNIGNGTLTIQRNGSNVGTFTANQNTGSTINISVPTDLNQLTGTQGLLFQQDYDILYSPEPVIDLLKPNYFYDCDEPLTALTINSFETTNPNNRSTWIYPETHIFFLTYMGFELIVSPTNCLFSGEDMNSFEDNTYYLITIKGAMIDIKKLTN